MIDESQEIKRRNDEAKKLVNIIDTNNLTSQEYKFVRSIISRLNVPDIDISLAVIYHLRDIKDRQLERD